MSLIFFGYFADFVCFQLCVFGPHSMSSTKLANVCWNSCPSQEENHSFPVSRETAPVLATGSVCPPNSNIKKRCMREVLLTRVLADALIQQLSQCPVTPFSAGIRSSSRSHRMDASLGKRPRGPSNCRPGNRRSCTCRRHRPCAESQAAA